MFYECPSLRNRVRGSVTWEELWLDPPHQEEPPGFKRKSQEPPFSPALPHIRAELMMEPCSYSNTTHCRPAGIFSFQKTKVQPTNNVVIVCLGVLLHPPPSLQSWRHSRFSLRVASYRRAAATNVLICKSLMLLSLKVLVGIPRYVTTKSETNQRSSKEKNLKTDGEVSHFLLERWVFPSPPPQWCSHRLFIKDGCKPLVWEVKPSGSDFTHNTPGIREGLAQKSPRSNLLTLIFIHELLIWFFFFFYSHNGTNS